MQPETDRAVALAGEIIAAAESGDLEAVPRLLKLRDDAIQSLSKQGDRLGEHERQRIVKSTEAALAAVTSIRDAVGGEMGKLRTARKARAAYQR